MNKKIREFKNYIEEVARNNFFDYDAVEELEGFNYEEYNKAVHKINEMKEDFGFATYKELFTNKEMLKISVMYACIVCGAIESEVTKHVNNEIEKFQNDMREFEYSMKCSLY